ncbi:hypothetical protein GUITHDRAFT_99540 [Guillardia theta CCMP2712]|uniref:PA14 domain-containing protein n=1 Tax=Guillardia theta (strain CCMP2712) TaxID=905079 RepID=L1K2R6_GUITC|nr:hypothetical protein GUITHDRAFT_99540 [Guillardia theta CCMP2712]EKX54889.1 hypothetical protein GUITHDRAFT_99540 [Guillardia theta CCMP2712]|eukprot:XP_005841869.1 hypothetical protein GUITHDRAFT_99540 [Guillardia theta CCMP2712]
MALIIHVTQPSATILLTRSRETRTSKLSLLTAPVEYIAQSMRKSIADGAKEAGGDEQESSKRWSKLKQALKEFRMTVEAEDNSPPCQPSKPGCAPCPHCPPSPAAPVPTFKREVNMLGFGKMEPGKPQAPRKDLVTEGELDQRLKWLEHTIASMSEEVATVKADQGPPGPPGMARQDTTGKMGSKGSKGSKGSEALKALMGSLEFQIFAAREGERLGSSVPNLASLQFVGSAIVRFVDMSDVSKFRKFVEDTPSSDFVYRFSGHVKVEQAGKYTFCSTSDLLSRVFVDFELLVENKQADEKSCGDVELEQGLHAVMVDGVHGDGEGGVVLTYRGRDTDYEEESVRSVDSRGPPPPPHSRFLLRVFASNKDLDKFPDLRDVSLLGHSIVPSLSFDEEANSMAQFIPDPPTRNVAWQAFGRFSIYKSGQYKFCSLSSDGSLLYIDSELLIHDDRVQSPTKTCRSLTLARGLHDVHVDGFKHEGEPIFRLSYEGPDTGGLPADLNSVAPRAPQLPRPSQWLIRAYRSSQLLQVPSSTAGLELVGEAVVHSIDFKGTQGLVEDLPALPQSEFVLEAFGRMEVGRPGAYSLCLTSKDGSVMELDGRSFIHNDGRHAAKRVCNEAVLRSGTHLVKIVSFLSGGTFQLLATYKGPDTEDEEEVIDSDEAMAF